MTCKLCGTTYHYCTSCDDEPPYNFDVCYGCWNSLGLEPIHRDACERADKIVEEMEAQIKGIIDEQFRGRTKEVR